MSDMNDATEFLTLLMGVAVAVAIGWLGILYAVLRGDHNTPSTSPDKLTRGEKIFLMAATIVILAACLGVVLYLAGLVDNWDRHFGLQ